MCATNLPPLNVTHDVSKSPSSRRDQFSAYLAACKDNEIQGWADLDSLVLAASLTRWQHQQLELFGRVGEIGVHHGKYFGSLALAASAAEPLFAVDVFRLQQHNLDKSGAGDLATFSTNMKRFGVDMAAIMIVEGKSQDLSEALLSSGEFGANCCTRFASIDGGHTLRTVLHDLNIISCLLCQGGIVAVDDYMSAEWPQVTDALHRFLVTQPSRHASGCVPVLVPFLAAFRKVYLISSEHHAAALSYVSDSSFEWASVLVRDPVKQSWTLPERGFDNCEKRSFEYVRLAYQTSYTRLQKLLSQMDYFREWDGLQ